MTTTLRVMCVGRWEVGQTAPVVTVENSLEAEMDAILAATPPAVRADVAIGELLDDDDFRVPGELHYRSTRL